MCVLCCMLECFNTLALYKLDQLLITNIRRKKHWIPAKKDGREMKKKAKTKMLNENVSKKKNWARNHSFPVYFDNEQYYSNRNSVTITVIIAIKAHMAFHNLKCIIIHHFDFFTFLILRFKEFLLQGNVFFFVTFVVVVNIIKLQVL